MPCEWRICSSATTNPRPAWKLLSADCDSDLAMIGSWPGAEANSKRASVRRHWTQDIRRWCAPAKNSQLNRRHADVAPGSRFPAELMCRWSLEVGPAICEQGSAVCMGDRCAIANKSRSVKIRHAQKV